MDLGPTAGLDLVWIPAEGGDVTLISPARGASRPHFATGGRSDLRDHARRPGLDAVRRHRPPHASQRRRQDRLQAERARSRRRDPASPGRPWALARAPTSSMCWRCRRSAARRPRSPCTSRPSPLKKLTDMGADYADWTDGGKTITWAVGSSVFRLPFDSVVFTSSRPRRARRTRRSRQGRKGAGEAQARGDRRRRRAAEAPAARDDRTPRGEGRHHARRRGDRRRRHRRHRPSDRRRRAQRLGQGTRGRQDPRRRRDDHRARLRRHPRPLDGDPPRGARHAETGASSPTSPTA